MYIPGRSRTGSRPSRTVMSFAVYAASAKEKALQTDGLGAALSVSETAVGQPARKTPGGSFSHFCAQIGVADSGNEVGGQALVGRSRAQRRPRQLRRRLERGLGNRSNPEAKTGRSRLARLLGQPGENLRRQLAELKGPDRR